MIRSFIIMQVFFVLLFSECYGNENKGIYDLRCENLRNPFGIDKTMPRFSWKIKSDKNGTEQKAFQLMVASKVSLLNQNKSDLWNSEKTASSDNNLVSYKGVALTSGTVVYWKVRVWDENGQVSSWSPVAEFSIGLLNKEDWNASYIGFPSSAGFSDCPQLKKSFNIADTGEKMFLYVNSLGYHEVYLNGKKVGDGVLTPAVSQYNKRSLVITYDVSSLIKKGRNDLVFWLGSGWYSSGYTGVVGTGPLVKAQLEQLTGKQRKIVLATNSSWEGRSSEYTRIAKWRSMNFGGEEIDGNRITKNLSGKSLDDGSWKPVAEVTVPEHVASPQMVEVNQIRETIKAAKVSAIADNEYLVDMGTTLTGWVEIHFPKLEKSQVIVMEYSDDLDKNGKINNQNQVDRYIASGDGMEVFKNKFNYHGFRYIKISNLKQAPDKNLITAYLIHTGYELASSFQCSDPDLNKIHDMIFYTLRCLSLGGYLVDCPQLERLGYGGDGNASTETAQTMFNLAPLYANWLQAWGDGAQEDGGMPHTAPGPGGGGGPYWCAFIVEATWNTYVNYGDLTTLQKYYPVMQKFMGYCDKYTVDGLLTRWPDTNYRGWFLGDWAGPSGVNVGAQASVKLVTNCVITECYNSMQKIANALGKTNDAELYSQKREQLQKKIHQTFFDPSKNSYATGTQIDLAYPMLAGTVPKELIDGVTNSLVNDIKIVHGGHLATGLVGVPIMTEWAIKNQAVDLMYSMLKQKTEPGYLYMIENGATTTWEYWSGLRSHIHNCYNGIGSWFYQAVGGIRPSEEMVGYRKVKIQPQTPIGVTWAKTTKETPYGTLVVNWEIKANTMEMELEIPVGIDAEVVIPNGIKKYWLGGKEYNLSGGGSSIVNIKSGKYKIAYTPV